jgi:hypothetical protein
LRNLPRQKAQATAAKLVADPPDWALRWNVDRFLASVPGVGRVKIAEMHVAVSYSGVKTIGGLTPHKRAAVVGRLLEWSERASVAQNGNRSAA